MKGYKKLLSNRYGLKKKGISRGLKINFIEKYRIVYSDDSTKTFVFLLHFNQLKLEITDTN